jgi:ABC-type tungstate transport system substrate-binding protein
MGPYVLRAFLLVGVVALVIGMMLEVRNWRTGRRIISRKQQVIRLSTGVLLIILFGMMIAGGSVADTGNPFGFMLYWMGCFVVGCLAVVLMLLDLREVGETYRKQHKEILKRLSEEAKRK